MSQASTSVSLDGFLVIDKAQEMTSFDVIRRLRKILNTRKMGHAGTLDPDATGVLVVAIGAGTKLLPFLPLDEKVYGFELVFGSATDSGDATGAVVAESNKIPGQDELLAILPTFTGTITQIPPRYSAVHVDGRRAYELARQGEEFEIPSRQVEIQALQLCEFADKFATLEVQCSSGTYVRSLAVDIASALGTVGHARAIRRKRVGTYALEDAATLESLEGASVDEARKAVGSLLDFAGSLPQVALSPVQVEEIGHGRSIQAQEVGDQQYVALHHDGRLVAIAECDDGRLQPRRVFR